MAKKNKNSKKVLISKAEPNYVNDASSGLPVPEVTEFTGPDNEEENQTLSPVVITRHSTAVDYERFKSAYKIENDTIVFAFNFKELPNFFYQNERIIFKCVIATTLNQFEDFDHPIWFSPVTNPKIAGLCEAFRLAYEDMVSSGIQFN